MQALVVRSDRCTGGGVRLSEREPLSIFYFFSTQLRLLLHGGVSNVDRTLTPSKLSGPNAQDAFGGFVD